jgi:hypothetical protein
MANLDWGSVPAWISSICTSASVAVAAGAYWKSVSDKRREQASKITVWSPRSVLPPATGIEIEPKYEDVTVAAKNASDAAVKDVRVVLDISTKEVKSGTKKFAWVRARKNWNLGDLGPDQAETTTLSNVITVAVTELTFMDSAGRSWRRDEFGKLMDMSAVALDKTWLSKFNPVRITRSIMYLITRCWFKLQNRS